MSMDTATSAPRRNLKKQSQRDRKLAMMYGLTVDLMPGRNARDGLSRLLLEATTKAQRRAILEADQRLMSMPRPEVPY
jgi:hypothetical protein